MAALGTPHATSSGRSATRHLVRSRWLAIGLLIVVCPRAPVLAEPLHQRIEGRFSAGVLSVRDDLLVPYAFTGPELNLGASYGLWRDRHAFELRIEAGSAGIWTRAKEPGIYVHYEISASFSECAYADARRALWIGALLRAGHELAYLAAWDDAHGYWLDAIMLGPSLLHAERLSAGLVLELSGDLSLIGAATRPPARRLNKQDALSHGSYHFDRLAEVPMLAWVGQTSLARATALVRWRSAVAQLASGFGLGLESRIAHARKPEPYTSWYLGVVGSFAWSWP